MYGFLQVSKGACRGQKKVSDSLELEIDAIVNCLLWALGAKLWSPGRTVCTLDH